MLAAVWAANAASFWTLAILVAGAVEATTADSTTATATPNPTSTAVTMAAESERWEDVSAVSAPPAGSTYVTAADTAVASGPPAAKGPRNTDVQRLLATALLLDRLQQTPSVVHRLAPVTAGLGRPQVDVHVEILLSPLLGLDDARRTMTSELRLNVTWRDGSLAWVPEEHGGVGEVELPLGALWVPSLMVVNTDRDFGNPLEKGSLLLLSHDGSVCLPAVLKVDTACIVDHSNFPFDVQQCPIILTSVTSVVRLALSYRSRSDEQNKYLSFVADWSLENVKHIPFIYDGKPAPTLFITLRRKTLFYASCFVTPMVLTSYLNLLVFLVPLQSGEKLSFLVSIYVSTSVFVAFFVEVLPRGLEIVPTTLKLLLGVIAESLLVLLATLFVMRRYHQEQEALQSTSGKTLNMKNKIDPRSPAEISSRTTITTGLAAGKPSRVWPMSVCEDAALVTSPGNSEIATSAQGTDAPWRTTAEMISETGPGSGAVVRRTKRKSLTAQQLDNVFFVLSFVAVTTFILYLWCQ